MTSVRPLMPTTKEKNLDEEMIDKFATLFSPPTPRASPIPRDDNDEDSIWKTPSTRHPIQHFEPSTPDSEFGAFVSVPASEDPLAGADVDDFSFGEGQAQGHARTPSLSFFDQFAKEAKVASEKNRKEVLDELLDPLGPSWGGTSGGVPQHPANDSTDRKSWGQTEPSPSLIDLDNEYFASSSPGSRNHRRSRTVESHTYPSRHQTQTSIASIARSPSRSPTLSTLAPPVTSEADAQANASSNSRPGISTRSTSYQTLTNISAKWMSGLLSSSSSSSTSPPPPGRASLDSLFFSHPRNTGANGHGHGSTTTTTATTTTTGVNMGASAAAQRHHSPSPFAPHVFVPGSISGAPGFMGERYDWDQKGFSTELSHEYETERDTTPSSFSSASASMGGLIEKKTGHVELKGRRESTEGVLDVGLADKIRTHLPALSRLPKSWNLLYSLDQHGISLNTLYTNSEAAPSLSVGVGGSGLATKVGALVVVKDSGDAVFGVFIGDGLHRGKGYYGSGESFLWKHSPGPRDELEVFKWTGKNGYVALCEADFVSFGGGDGTYGLYIDSTLLEGSSAPCPTFGNPPLCSTDTPGSRKGRTITFECVGLEVWGVGP